MSVNDVISSGVAGRMSPVRSKRTSDDEQQTPLSDTHARCRSLPPTLLGQQQQQPVGLLSAGRRHVSAPLVNIPIQPSCQSTPGPTSRLRHQWIPQLLQLLASNTLHWRHSWPSLGHDNLLHPTHGWRVWIFASLRTVSGSQLTVINWFRKTCFDVRIERDQTFKHENMNDSYFEQREERKTVKCIIARLFHSRQTDRRIVGYWIGCFHAQRYGDCSTYLHE